MVNVDLYRQEPIRNKAIKNRNLNFFKALGIFCVIWFGYRF